MPNLSRFVEEGRLPTGFLLPLAVCGMLAARTAFAQPKVPENDSPPPESALRAYGPHENKVPVDPPASHPNAEQMKQASVLSCPGEAYRILILPGGQGFLQNLELSEDDPGAFVRLPQGDPINPPKSALTCSGKQFRIRTSPPYSNRSIDQQYSIGTDGIHLVSRRESDPAAQMIEDSFQIALRGNREALKSVDFSSIEYIYQYVNASRFQLFLDMAAKKCDQSATCQPVIESTFFLITRLSSAASGNEYDPDQPISWIRALDDTGVQIVDAAPILLRYAEILRRQGRLRDAATLLNEMVQRDPNAPDLHLIYGDLLWDLQQKDAARKEYRIFADIIAREGRPLPTRVARLLADI